MENITFGELGKVFSLLETRKVMREFKEMHKLTPEEQAERKILDEAFKDKFKQVFGVRPK